MSDDLTGVVLAEGIQIRSHFQRSVNLERDGRSVLPAYYMPTARALDATRRWAAAMLDPSRPRAWSITGPYGSGKSSFALFLEALVARGSDPVHLAAREVLRDVDSGLSEMILTARRRWGCEQRGFIKAAATADREPVAVTVARALWSGACQYWPTRMPSDVLAALADIGDGVPSASKVLAALDCLCQRAPVMLVIDEFGKNLEAFAAIGGDADLYVLQGIAELCSSDRNAPLSLFTLQHLAFSDYAAGLSHQQRREWSKVQGRFEDVAFTGTPEETTHVVAGVYDHSKLNEGIRREVVAWASREYRRYSEMGFDSRLGGSADSLAACYPLHPLVLLVLPELCTRYAQSNRTLFGFLCGPEPGTVASWLRLNTPSDPLPVVTLDDLYRYFIESVAPMFSATGEASRWLEIERRLREVQGLSDDEASCLRVAAILNLVSSGGLLRASRELVVAALTSSGLGSLSIEAADRAIESLVDKGLMTYREHADEYRVWHGSDFDIQGTLLTAIEQQRRESPASLLESVAPAAPIVANRHSQRTGILRYFGCVFVDAATKDINIPGRADGVLVYALGDLSPTLTEELATYDRPVVVIRFGDVQQLVDAAVEFAAHAEVLQNSPELKSDWVARRELQERYEISARGLGAAIQEAVGPASDRLLMGTRPRRLDSSVPLNRLISDICDEAYHSAPPVRNEMIARRELTSQAAKARRELLEAMISSESVERLGLSGYGPERAMYEALLLAPGFHRGDGEGGWSFRPPSSSEGWFECWQVLEAGVCRRTDTHLPVTEVWRLLSSPPIGLKSGTIPVLFTVALLCWSEEVAIYQDGTFQPTLDAALLERMIKAPERFALKWFGLSGVRSMVIEAVSEAFGFALSRRRQRRNATVLSIVAPLLARVRSLPAYTRLTRSLSRQTDAVRSALLTAREPDELLFEALPRACGMEPFEPGPKAEGYRAMEFASRLKSAMSEMEGAYPALLATLKSELASEFDVPNGEGMRSGLRGRAQTLVERILDPKLRATLLTACDTSLDEQQWIEAMAMAIGDGPPHEWREEHVEHFRYRLRSLSAAYAHVEALYYAARPRQLEEGFESRRVTITAPDGTATNRVVWIERSEQPVVDELVTEVLEKLERRLGGEAGGALLAKLAMRLYEDEGKSPVVREGPEEAHA